MGIIGAMKTGYKHTSGTIFNNSLIDQSAAYQILDDQLGLTLMPTSLTLTLSSYPCFPSYVLTTRLILYRK